MSKTKFTLIVEIEAVSMEEARRVALALDRFYYNDGTPYVPSQTFPPENFPTSFNLMESNRVPS